LGVQAYATLLGLTKAFGPIPAAQTGRPVIDVLVAGIAISFSFGPGEKLNK
jgi:hypothetical protein